jgi:rhodanese-related sulfurtransferase
MTARTMMTRRCVVAAAGRVVAAAPVWLAMANAAAAGDGVLSAGAAQRMVADGAVTLIDVRTPQEWRRTGIAAGAKRADILDRDGIEGFIGAVLAAVEGDRRRPVALICARGFRSTRAQALLHKRGFATVYNVREGMLGRDGAKGWIAAGLPLEPCPAC